MSDTLSFAEIVSQHVELLPARTVLSLFARDTNSGNTTSDITKLLIGFISHSSPGTPGESGASSS